MTDSRGDGQASEELRGRYGDSIELQSEDGAAQLYRIAAELIVNGRRYAVLQTEEMRRDDEIEVFLIGTNADGEIELESVADEEEWELVAEAFDDLQFGSEERP